MHPNFYFLEKDSMENHIKKIHCDNARNELMKYKNILIKEMDLNKDQYKQNHTLYLITNNTNLTRIK